MIEQNPEMEINRLKEALRGCVDLIEDWAYGPLFNKTGIQWPDGKCRAPALLEAKRILDDPR